MKSVQLEKQILHYLQDLSNEALREVIEFIMFLNSKKSEKKSKKILLFKELKSLNKSEAAHLEDEFKNYKVLYPREK